MAKIYLSLNKFDLAKKKIVKAMDIDPTNTNYKSLYSKKGYYLLSLGKTLSSWDASVFKYTNASVDTFFVRDNMESDEYLKFDIVHKHRSNIEFSAGLNIKYGKYSMIESLDPDSVYQYTYSSLNDFSN